MSKNVPHNGSIALIALGSNQAEAGLDVAETLRKALHYITRRGGVIRDQSRYFRTPCFPVGAGPDFVNAAISIETTLSPTALLQFLHEVEADFGRVRRERWGQRTLDLDLIAYGDQIIPNESVVSDWITLPLEKQTVHAPEQLILPHPRLQDRSFVLVPLMDIAPDWRHPVLGQSIRQMHDRLLAADKASVKPLDIRSDHA